ncbi:tetratricopeptide repeat protein [Opitutus terrae]|uniref:Tetratricopeptide TPR_2 repeat protein n=1 Tax=Opitutus terrae (strain DSM 11246 / JCM 15787 / PB90-1) TaxID=452637 RepID=B2A058_OPITP|nr:tetratricopeptide repeat protein [Opitutus terrae]ACB77394.1 Tetratricopeptide TPR_2 repeat protein [Opitutus terrae PB90-1]
MSKNPTVSRWWRGGLAAVGLIVVLPSGRGADYPLAPAPSAPAAEPAVAYVPPENPSELLRLDEPMRRYFRARLSRHASGYDRLCALVDSIIQPDGLAFAYDGNGTYDARETFRRRRGNCASFAFLVVAVAREFDIDASFQNVERATRWNRVGDMVVAVLHLDVKVSSQGRNYIIDLEPGLIPPRDSSDVRLIRDERAFAQFYCNIGFDELVRGDADRALHYMARATEIDPSCATAWANRATLLSRLGDLATARKCFERSLRADSRGEAALDGFVSLLRQLGTPADLQQADKLERRARAIRERNPYYQQQLAAQAQEQGDLARAEKHLRRAISLKDDEPEFYAQRLAVLEQLGRSDDARRVARQLENVRTRLMNMPEQIVP